MKRIRKIVAESIGLLRVSKYRLKWKGKPGPRSGTVRKMRSNSLKQNLTDEHFTCILKHKYTLQGMSISQNFDST